MLYADHWWLLPLLATTLAALVAVGFVAFGPDKAVVVAAGGHSAVTEQTLRKRARGRMWVAVVVAAATGSAGAAWMAVKQETGDRASEIPVETERLHAAFDDTTAVGVPSALPRVFVGELATGVMDRDWGKLDPRFRQRLESVLGRLQQRGHSFMLIEGYRSPQRQNALFEQPVRVTFARAGQSRHQFGLAADLAPMQGARLIDGDEAMDAYRALGEEAEAAGLHWGGRWWFRDYGHVELPAARSPEQG